MSVIEPFDPMCETFAKDMSSLDYFIFEDEGSMMDAHDSGGVEQMRADYIREEEGTYNSENGHFLCDNCYIKAGMPSSSGGWVCP